MACDGFNHEQRVILINDLPMHNIYSGEIGTITNIYTTFHIIDVNFEKFGLIYGLDATNFEIYDRPSTEATL
jgi:hypothetical protein